MKRLTAFLLAAALALLPGCSQNAPSSSAASSGGESASSVERADVTLPQSLTVSAGGVTVEVDPMMELLSIIQYLGDYNELFGLITDVETSYQTDIDAYFAPYKDHAAIQFFNSVAKQGFAFDVPPTACLYLGKDFSISQDFEGSDYQRNRFPTEDLLTLPEFRDHLSRFAADTNFSAFFDSHRDFYTKMMEAYAASFPQWNMTTAMEEYYGKTAAGYTIILVPLFHPGGFGPSLPREDGLHIYSITGPYYTDGTLPNFGDAEDIANLVLHEFGHSFLPINDMDNPTMVAEVERSAYLIDPIRERMEAMAYPQWTPAYEELVLRACVIDMALQNTGVPPEEMLGNERENGFIYIDTVYETLRLYNTNRTAYPNIDTFIPTITDALLAKYPKK